MANLVFSLPEDRYNGQPNPTYLRIGKVLSLPEDRYNRHPSTQPTLKHPSIQPTWVRVQWPFAILVPNQPEDKYSGLPSTNLPENRYNVYNQFTWGQLQWSVLYPTEDRYSGQPCTQHTWGQAYGQPCVESPGERYLGQPYTQPTWGQLQCLASCPSLPKDMSMLSLVPILWLVDTECRKLNLKLEVFWSISFLSSLF